MALTDDLKDYIARNGTTTTVIKEKHNVAIVGETHAFLKTTTRRYAPRPPCGCCSNCWPT